MSIQAVTSTAEQEVAMRAAVHQAMGGVDVLARYYKVPAASLQASYARVVNEASAHLLARGGTPAQLAAQVKRARRADTGTIMLKSLFDDFFGYFLPAALTAVVVGVFTLAASPLAGLVAGLACAPLQWWLSSHMHEAAHKMSHLYDGKPGHAHEGDKEAVKHRPRFSLVPPHASVRRGLWCEAKAHLPAQVGFRFLLELPINVVRITLAALKLAAPAIAPLGVAALAVGTLAGPIASPLSNALSYRMQAKREGVSYAPVLGVSLEGGELKFSADAAAESCRRLARPTGERMKASFGRMSRVYRAHWCQAFRESRAEGMTLRKGLRGFLGSNVPGTLALAPMSLALNLTGAVSSVVSPAVDTASRTARIGINACTRAASREKVWQARASKSPCEAVAPPPNPGAASAKELLSSVAPPPSPAAANLERQPLLRSRIPRLSLRDRPPLPRSFASLSSRIAVPAVAA